MLHYIPVAEENLAEAVRIQNTLFPSYNGEENYLDSIQGNTVSEYWLVYDEETCIGISGLYRYDTDPESAWLGWFGVLAPYRRQHYGKRIIAMFEETARTRGYQFARLYTDRDDNETAIAFYSSCGYTAEVYDCPEDPACAQWPVLIFSKSLTGREMVPWNHRNIRLTEQMEKELKPAKTDLQGSC